MSHTDTLHKVRRNHALEHATVSLLLERGVNPPLGGYSLHNGYLIWGKASFQQVSEAAGEALNLLRAGQTDLAISPFCGTNLVTSVLLGGIAATLARGHGRGLSANFRAAIAAIATASLLSRPVGQFIQRKFTTKAELNGLEIRSIRQISPSPVKVIWVSTGY